LSQPRVPPPVAVPAEAPAPEAPARPGWFARLSIQGKLACAFGVQLALVAAVAAAGLFGLRIVRRSFESAIEQGLRTERLAREIRSELLEARRHEKDFLLDWPNDYVKARREHVEAHRQHLARILAIIGDLEGIAAATGGPLETGIREDLVALKPYVDVYGEDFLGVADLVGARQAGGDGDAQELEHRISDRTENFREAALVIEPLVVHIAASGQNAAAAEMAAAAAASRRTLFGVSGIFLAALLTGLGLASWLGNRIRTPLRSLARIAEAVGGGDLGARAPVDSLDEIGTLARAFNVMTARLRGLIRSLEERVQERKRAEEALSASQRRLQDIIDNSSAVVYVKDLEGRYLLVNRRCQEIFRADKNEVVGKTDYQFFPRELADGYRQNDWKALVAGRSVETEEVMPLPDGLHTFISIKAPLCDESGQPYAVCGISTDITERKLVEEQLRQSQKMEAIGRLAGGIAHDFNNLLTAINGYSGLMLQRINEEHPFFEHAREIARSGHRAASLTRQLLAYSRKQRLEPRLWNPNLIIADMEAILRRLIGEDVTLVSELADEVGTVRVDRGQLEQILLNLAVNARDAMPSGGQLTLRTEHVSYGGPRGGALVGDTAGPQVMLAVTDTGTGMAPEVQARIFEPFFTTKEVGRGTGLGLSVVYGIVEQSGGSIEVDSEAGQGTTFRIYLPRVAGAGETVEDDLRGDATPTRGGNEAILLVEDEDGVRRFACHALEAHGYRVIPAASGSEALAVLGDGPLRVALVIADVVMPEISGRELMARVRARGEVIPVLYISGYEERSVTGGSLDPGEHFLAKPFSASELLRKTREILDGLGATSPRSAAGDHDRFEGS
jgi:two-component system cell cycle sensor histidine kinase/response regulator CckA